MTNEEIDFRCEMLVAWLQGYGKTNDADMLLALKARVEAAEAALELSRKLESEGYKALHYSEEAAKIEQWKARAETAEDKLERIRAWCDAYPLVIFPEPDFRKVQTALQAKGLTLDAVSASAMRLILDGLRKLIDQKETET